MPESETNIPHHEMQRSPEELTGEYANFVNNMLDIQLSSFSEVDKQKEVANFVADFIDRNGSVLPSETADMLKDKQHSLLRRANVNS